MTDFKPFRHELFVCECGDISHQFVITIDENDDSPGVFVEVRLNSAFCFLRRLIRGIRYIFKLGYPCLFGEYEEVILNETHIEPLKRVVKILEKRRRKTNETGKI